MAHGLAILLVATTLSNAYAESDAVEALRADYEARLTALQESFETRLAALEKKVATVEPKENDFRMYWEKGLRFDSTDGNFKLKLSGRIQNDWASYGDGGDFGDVEDGIEFRRTRIALSGTIYKNLHFKAQYDFAGGDVDFKDVYVGATVPAFGTLRIGHMKEPFSFNELTSSKDLTFMERALPNAFSPGRNVGISWANTYLNKRLTLAAGVFKDVGNFGDDKQREEEWAITGRIAGRPWLNEDGSRYLHLGAALSYRNVDGPERFRARPEAHAGGAGHYVDTRTAFDSDGLDDDDLMADRTLLLGLESAVVVGPFSLAGEYMMADVNARHGYRDTHFEGYYLEGSWFLTGEHKRYKTSKAAFDKVIPRKNFSFHKGGGLGAWELATRYSSIDLNNSGIAGGKEHNITLGLNWYLNPNTKIMLNYTHAAVDSRDEGINSDLDIMQGRCQLTW